LHVKRIPETKYLDIAMSIETLSLETATHVDELSPFRSGRLAQGSKEEYLKVILGRNLSGPANREPWFTSLEDRDVYTDETVSFKIGAEDPDTLDRLKYRCEADDLPGAEFNPEDGSFRWYAEEPGEYQVVFHVSDDGYPSLTRSETVRIRVTDPPPPEPEEPAATPLPSFDKARFAYVTAITEDAGRRQAWISLRLDGKILKLYEGEEFNVGEVAVMVRRIDDRSVDLEAPILDKQIRVQLGQNLAQGDDMVQGS
jgi:hypothetical protein